MNLSVYAPIFVPGNCSHFTIATIMTQYGTICPHVSMVEWDVLLDGELASSPSNWKVYVSDIIANFNVESTICICSPPRLGKRKGFSSGWNYTKSLL